MVKTMATERIRFNAPDDLAALLWLLAGKRREKIGDTVRYICQTHPEIVELAKEEGINLESLPEIGWGGKRR